MKDEACKLLQTINHKITILVHVMAYQMIEGKTLAEGAPVLKRLGFNAGEIAGIFDSTSNTINVLLSKAKKKKGGRRKRS